MTNSIFWCVWLLLSLLWLCFHVQKQLILHALAINLQMLTEMRLGILNMPHQIVGQVGIETKTFMTGVRNIKPVEDNVSIKMERPIL